MEVLMSTLGLMTVAVISPGPNNLIILRESLARGWRGALPVSLGVVLGGLGLLMTVLLGTQTLLSDPRFSRGLTVVSSLVLVVLGVVAMRGSWGLDASRAATGAHRGSPRPFERSSVAVGAMLLLQFVNPKGWILVTAVVSTLVPTKDPFSALPQLVALFVVVPSFSLLSWYLCGRLAGRYLARASVRAGFDRITGALFILSALVLLSGGLDVR